MNKGGNGGMVFWDVGIGKSMVAERSGDDDHQK